MRVKLRGELDYAALTSDQAATLQEVSNIRDRVVIDLSEVTFMDSGGISMLVLIARQHDQPLRLEGVQSVVRRMLEISGLAEVFDLGQQQPSFIAASEALALPWAASAVGGGLLWTATRRAPIRKPIVRLHAPPVLSRYFDLRSSR